MRSRERELNVPRLGGVKLPGVDFFRGMSVEGRQIKWFDVARM